MIEGLLVVIDLSPVAQEPPPAPNDHLLLPVAAHSAHGAQSCVCVGASSVEIKKNRKKHHGTMDILCRSKKNWVKKQKFTKMIYIYICIYIYIYIMYYSISYG